MTDPREDLVLIRIDFLRETLVPALEAEGLTYLHCPDSGCGEFAIQPIGARWVCPAHGLEGVGL